MYSARHRALTLVHLLATDLTTPALTKLCEAWDVEPALDHAVMDRIETIQRLAQAIITERTDTQSDV